MASPTVIDSLEFARSGQNLQDTVTVNQLPRLADSLFDVFGNLSYQVFGGFDVQHRPQLKLVVEGELNLKCQRCLGKLPYVVNVESSLLVLTAGDPAASAEIEDLDGIPADAHTSVWALVEDEVLLAIPYAARHAEGACSIDFKSVDDRAMSPFAELARLKQNRIQN